LDSATRKSNIPITLPMLSSTEVTLSNQPMVELDQSVDEPVFGRLMSGRGNQR